MPGGRLTLPLRATHVAPAGTAPAGTVLATPAPEEDLQLSDQANTVMSSHSTMENATLVQDYTTFWVQLNSSTVTLERGGALERGYFPHQTCCSSIC
ncbi:hypothetical protein NQZ68_020879 [Dissostichus eleginoides]|nr:hypothetical protein NQZ68_020879 [Dissostichus eleginoides]